MQCSRDICCAVTANECWESIDVQGLFDVAKLHEKKLGELTGIVHPSRAGTCRRW